MSEEVRDAPRTIPRILVQTIIINGTLAFAMTLVLLFFIGDVDSALSTPTGFPIIQIFYQATGSVKAATAMQASITIIGFASNIGVVASVSRLTWAFARDGGMPFSNFFAHVSYTFSFCSLFALVRKFSFVTYLYFYYTRLLIAHVNRLTLLIMFPFVQSASSASLSCFSALSTSAPPPPWPQLWR
jgi:amino acid transporter